MSSTPSIANSGASTPNSSVSSSNSSSYGEEFPYATSLDKRDIAAKSVYYQRLERALDLGAYMKQVEQILARPIKIPASHSHTINQKKTFFPVRGIWPSEERRKEKMSRLYSFHHMKGKEWLKDLVLEESDDEGETMEMSQKELRALLKTRKMERDLREHVKGDKLNSYHAYYGAGLLTITDSCSDGAKSKNKLVEVNQNALSQIAGGSQSAVPSPSPSPAPIITVALPDDAPEPLSVDANFSNSAVIPLPPLSH